MSVADTQDALLARFDAFAAERTSKEPSWVTTVRKAARDRFALLGFPGPRHEEWRFTPISPIVDTPFGLASPEPAGVSRDAVAPFLVPDLACPTLVFVNGHYAPGLSSTRSLPKGVVFATLGEILERDPGLIDPYFTRCASFDAQAFTALNTAFAEDGAVLHLPANTVVSEPFQILYYTSTDAPIATHPRTVIVAGDNSQARVIETYGGPEGQVYCTNAVTEIVGGENIHVDHYRLQRESRAAYHVASTHLYLERAAVFAQQSFSFGGAIARHDVSAKLDAEGIECTLNGLYLGDGERLVDSHTTIDHAKPHCASHEIYKGMLDGRSRGVFNGKIFVRQDAQKTDAKQTNQVLLLSDDAAINTKPQLEIFADDVKCTHGATVGQLNAESLFYLRARGIGEDEARAMLVHAFASDIIDRVKVEALRGQLEDTLLGYLPRT